MIETAEDDVQSHGLILFTLATSAIIIAGILMLVAYMTSKMWRDMNLELGTPITTTTTQPTSNNAPTTAPTASTINIMGEIISVGPSSLAMKTTSPIGNSADTKVYIVTPSKTATYYHQVLQSGTDSVKSYRAEPGKWQDMKRGYFLSVSTFNDVLKNTRLTAEALNYSETNPLK